MGDPVNQSQFYERMQQSDDKFQESHRRLRELIEESVRDLKLEMAQHAKDDAVVEKRVTIIETQRAEEAKVAMKHGAWAGVIAAAGLSGAIQLVKAYFGK